MKSGEVRTIYTSQSVTASYRKGSSRYLLVCFGDAGLVGLTDEPPRRGFVEKADLSAVFVYPARRNWFPQIEMDPCIRAIREFAGDVEIITFGASMGGYGAIKYARKFGACRVVAFAPQYSIDPTIITNKRDPYTINFDTNVNCGMEICPADVNCAVDVIFDPCDENDREHFSYIARITSCRAICVHLAGHALESMFGGGTDIADLVDSLRVDDITKVRGLVRARKRQSVYFHMSLFGKTVDKKPRIAGWALRKASTLPPLGPEDLNSRLQALVLQGRADLAEPDLRAGYESTKRRPVKWLLASALAHCYDVLGKREEHLSWERTAAAHAPNDENVRLRLANALIQRNIVDEAEPILTEIIRNFDKPYAYFGMCQIFARRGDLERGIAAGLRAVISSPNNHSWRARVAELLLQAGRDGEAEALVAGATRWVGDAGSWHLWARHLHSKGRFAEAVAAARRAVTLSPSNVGMRSQLANALRAIGQIEGAVDVCLQTTECWPWRAEGFVALAQSLDAKGELERAKCAARHATELQPHASVQWAILVDVLTRTGDLHAASAAAANAERACHSPKSPLLAAIARLRARQGDPEAAMEAIMRAIVDAPLAAGLHGALANFLMQAGRTVEAADAARLASSLAPAVPGFHRQLITALEKLGKTNEVIEECRRAVSLHPGVADFHSQLVERLVAQGNLMEACVAADSAISDGVENAMLYSQHAKALSQLAELEKAIVSQQGACELAPNHAGFHSALANFLMQAGRTAEAADAARLASRLAPAVPGFHRQLVTALEKLGKTNEVIEECRRAVTLHPGVADFHSQLVERLVSQGNLMEACVAADSAISDGVENAMLHSQHAKALSQLAELEKAIVSQQRACELAPNHAGFLGTLAGMLMRAKRFNEAAAAANCAVTLQPDVPWLANVLKLARNGMMS